MRSKQAAPPNGTQSSRSHMRPFVAALLLIAGGAWLALALQAGPMGLMPVTMGVAMPSFVVMWTLMVAAMMVPSITPVDSIVSEVTLEDIPRVTRAMLGGHTRGRILVRPSEQ